MSKVKSVVFHGLKRVGYEDWDFDTSPPRSGEVTGRTLATLISPGTELNSAFERKRESSAVGGYAAIVEIDAVGPDVTGVSVGERVFTLGGHRARYRGMGNQVVLVPKGLANEMAVFARLMGVSWTTLMTTQARPHDRVVIFGLGIVGNMAAQIFTGAGYRVTALDLDNRRCELARSHGLTDVRNTLPADDNEVRGQAAIAIDCAGHEAVVYECCKVVRKGGEVVMIGVPWKKRCDTDAFELLHAVFHNYVNLRSGWEWQLPWQPCDFSRGSIRQNFEAALAWLAAGRVKVDGLATVMPPSDAQKAYDGLFTQSLPGLSVIFDWS